MKALIFAFVMPFTMLFSGEQTTVNSEQNISIEESFDLFKKVEVDVEIDLGRKKKGCSGFGVCGVVISGSVIDVVDGSGAFGKITFENGRATSLFIHRASLNAQTLKTYFSGSTFVVGENFKATLRHKGQSFIIFLKAGKYRMQKTSKGFNIGMPPTLK